MLHEYNRIRSYWNITRYNWRETSTMIITLWYFELLKYVSIYNSHVTFWDSNVTDYCVVIILERLQKWWFNVSTQVTLK